MLRHCVQGARVQQKRSWRWCSSLVSSSSLDYDNSSSGAYTNSQHHYHRHQHLPKRYFGISRNPDPLTRHGSINTVGDDNDADIDVASADGVASPVTADDLEYGEIERDSNFMSRQMNTMSAWQDDDDDGNDGDDGFDLFDGSGFGKGGDSEYNDNDDDDADNMDQQSIADAAFHERQQKIKDELDQRTGRLWTDEWIISEEEWLANKTWDDIEEWKPELATRKSLESVKVFDGGVPTLQQLSELNLPPSLSSHPGHGSPKTYAIHRKKQIRSRLRMAIQLSIHDDLQKILQMESWSDKQEAVDDLFEVIEDRVREREPVLGKQPDFGIMVENGLEQVLRMVQSRMRGTATKVDDDTDNTDTTADEEAATTNKDKEEDILDVAGANVEELVPVFMDISNVKNPPNSAFLSESNEAGVPNLIYPLNVHHREGVGRMVEEWELAANKETKRIMMRDATKAIASKIVGAANCCDTAVSDNVKGAARVLVTGKRGVGKVSVFFSRCV